MNSTIYIRDNDTLEIKSFDMNLSLDEDGELFIYGYTEGNFSCDCNRDIMFRELSDMQDGIDCGETKYSLMIIDNRTDKEIYSEL